MRATAVRQEKSVGLAAPALGAGAPLFWDPRLATLLDYWNAKRDRRAAPMRGDLDPCDIPQLLPYINLLEVTTAPFGFRHRLVGTEVVNALGRDATGHCVGEALYGRAAAEVFETLSQVVKTGRPHRRRARLDWHRHDWLTMESVELPLLDAHGRVAMILRGSSFGRGPAPLTARLAFDPLPV